jgi:N-acetylglucosaminyl-diphospho-decaprenol L-rhamnosyltransferase
VTDLTIIIVSHNTRVDLDRCLQSLADGAPSVPHDIVVVDNASADGSVDRVRERWPGVRLIESDRNVGFARANNLAIRATRSELLLLLNSDTVAPPGAIDRLVAGLRARTDAAAVGPRIVDGDQRAELSFGAMLGPWTELKQKAILRLARRGVPPVLRWIDRQTRVPKAVDWVSGACLLVWREDADAVGLLDERYFIYCEDVDFCAALRHRGRRIWFLPSAEIVHYRGRSVASAPAATEAAYRRSQMSFYAKHRPRWLPWLKGYLRLRGKLPSPAADT